MVVVVVVRRRPSSSSSHPHKNILAATSSPMFWSPLSLPPPPQRGPGLWRQNHNLHCSSSRGISKFETHTRTDFYEKLKLVTPAQKAEEMASCLSQKLLVLLPCGRLGMTVWGRRGGSSFGSAASREIHASSSNFGSQKGPGTTSSSLPSEAVFYHPKHDMYVCWHPEVAFPYEMSKPIPTEIPGTESALKIQSLVPVREVFRKKNERLILRELVRLTYTPKYGFMGKYGKKKRDVLRDLDPLKQTRDREYL